MGNNIISDTIIDLIEDNIACIIEIDIENDSYMMTHADEFFEANVKPHGKLRKLYSILFSVDEVSQTGKINNYSTFIDTSVFKKNRYRGGVEFDVNGKDKRYSFSVICKDEKKAYVLFFEDEYVQKSNNLELEKIDTIQETYLFSMIINLATDTCVNPNTTEVSVNRQDYMEIKYSDWRLMISNMFKDEDKVLFLRASAPENVINKLELQEHFHIDLQMMNMQGQYVWCRLRFVRMKNFSRENPRFVYTVQDISEDIAQLMKQEGLVKAVEEQNERLQEADKNRTKFFSNMSHEIRTPINAIMGMNEVILRDCEDEKIKGYAKDVQSASQYLLSLVNDILDYSKIEAGKMEIVPVEYDFSGMIEGVCNIVKTKLVSKHIDFNVVIDENVPKRLFGDEIRISQILINLLTNAIKYTDEGSVDFLVDRLEDEAGQASIRFTIKDTGIGIKQEDMETLFEEFGRLDMLKNRNKEGHGLGICIVQGLLSQMNSQLKVESVYGSGSTFSFVLLQKEVTVTENVEPDIAMPDIKGKKVLIVDDTTVNLHIFKAMIAPYEVDVDTAKSGMSALELMENERYDIVFLDHMMPMMDGIETLHRLREINEYYKNVPVIALTGNYSSTARAEYISMGFNDYLEKPLVLDKLEEIIYKYL